MHSKISLKGKVKNTFEFGDRVRIVPMFFRNHGMKISEVIGDVKEIVPKWESPTPLVKVMFDYSPVFIQCSQNGYLKYVTVMVDHSPKMIVRIHPMYLEKVK